MTMATNHFSPVVGKVTGRHFLAWCVHFYTALGLVAAAGIALAIIDGTPASFRAAFLLMFIATVIDGTDGAFARMVRVKEVLPGFDGRRLDDLVDFQTYTSLPLLLIWRANILAPDHAWCLLIPLLASAYGFCQVSAKTGDGYFLGFPSYWNLVAFYLYVLQPMPEGLALGTLLLFSFLTFVPSRYLYPSQKGFVNRVTTSLGAVWACLLIWILWMLPAETPGAGQFADDGTRLLAMLSLAYPVYYMAVSWLISVKYWLRKARRQQDERGSSGASLASAQGSGQ
jgi:phosphatidylcholine synthase